MDRGEYTANLKKDAVTYLKGAFSQEDLRNESAFRRVDAIRSKIRSFNRQIESLAEEMEVLGCRLVGRRRNAVLQADADSFGDLSMEVLASAIGDSQDEGS